MEVFGLKSQPDWNGKQAKISNEFNWEKGRYPICIIINDSSNEALLKPSNLKLISKRQKDEQDNKQNESQYFELVVTKEKGVGMIAACDINKGTTIFNDKPLLNIPRNKSKDDNVKKQCIIDQFKSLSDDDKKKVLNYHIQIDTKTNDDDDNKEDDDQVLGIYFTNAFTIINDESEIESGFFPNIARMNHSCLSNCEVLNYDLQTKSRSIIALFDIKKGDELSINYIGNCYYTLSMTQKVRKEYILSNFNFQCKCIHCINYDTKIEKFRKTYGKLMDVIDENVNNFNKKAFKTVLAASQQMMNIIMYGFNGYPTILSQCYINAAHATLFLNEYEKSLKYLKKSVEIDQMFYGNKAIFDDVEECLAKIPNKYQQKYPWHHVLNLE